MTNRSPLFQTVLAVVVLAAIVLAARSYSAQTIPDDGSLRLWVLDIGQGDAILIDTPEHQQILVDGGPDSSVVQRLGQILPLGDRELDLVISTHNDADHLSGLNSVLASYKVNKIWLTGAVHTTQTYKKFIDLIAEKSIPADKITAGSKAEFGQLQAIAIWPIQSYDGVTPSDQNAPGIVTYWQYGSDTFLLTGDVEEAEEREMVSRGLVKPVEVLKVAHHGSHTSSTEAFLAASKPQIAVISVGRQNKYGHPHQDVLARFNQLAIKVLRTDLDETIRFNFSGQGYSYTLNAL